MVPARDQLDDAEAEPDAAGLSRQALIDAVEAAEDASLFADRDTDAVVFDGKHHRSITVRGWRGR